MPFTEEEKRERKNARQRDYAKRTGYAANAKYQKEHVRRFVINLVESTDGDMIEYLEKQSNKAGYIKALIRKDMEKNF